MRGSSLFYKLHVNVVGVFIANEENSSILGIGVDELVKRGMMERCKNGPVFWIDSADKQARLVSAVPFIHLLTHFFLFTALYRYWGYGGLETDSTWKAVP